MPTLQTKETIELRHAKLDALEEQVKDLYRDAHMKPVITPRCAWYYMEDSSGEGRLYDADRDTPSSLVSQFGCDIETLEHVRGVGVRFSAPGYMDKTDWIVFDTTEEAYEHVLLMQPGLFNVCQDHSMSDLFT